MILESDGQANIEDGFIRDLQLVSGLFQSQPLDVLLPESHQARWKTGVENGTGSSRTCWLGSAGPTPDPDSAGQSMSSGIICWSGFGKAVPELIGQSLYNPVRQS